MRVQGLGVGGVNNTEHGIIYIYIYLIYENYIFDIFIGYIENYNILITILFYLLLFIWEFDFLIWMFLYYSYLMILMEIYN